MKIIVLILFLGPGLYANQTEAESTQQYPTIKVNVKGMVCSFCAQGIQKQLGKEKSIKEVFVHLGEKLVIIKKVEKAEISDAVIEKRIQSSGFLVEKIERTKQPFAEIKKELKNGK